MKTEHHARPVPYASEGPWNNEQGAIPMHNNHVKQYYNAKERYYDRLHSAMLVVLYAEDTDEMRERFEAPVQFVLDKIECFEDLAICELMSQDI